MLSAQLGGKEHRAGYRPGTRGLESYILLQEVAKMFFPGFKVVTERSRS